MAVDPANKERAQSHCNSSIRSVNIRPKVTVLSVLAHLEYKAWFALAEYVDNAVQSYHECADDIRTVDGGDASLQVDIAIDSALNRITITDNAGGIALEDFPRAFRPAEIPPDTAGLSEFGMGMKSASCWFAPVWRVRTSAIGEAIERTVSFDIEKIVLDQLEELDVTETSVSADAHYTIIELDEVRSLPIGRTSGKIREHLADIYRVFLRNGELELVYRNESLSYEEPEILNAPVFNTDKEPIGEPQEWRKPIEFDFGNGLTVTGFAALRATGSTKYAGFSLFRRNRVIEGSADEKYRPAEIFGAPNSFVSQRLFGELHLEGFDVSHTKDGFRWDEEDEQTFLEILKEHLDEGEFPLLRQARNYREKAARAAKSGAAKKAVESTADALEKHGPEVVQDLAKEAPSNATPPEGLQAGPRIAEREFHISADGSMWTVKLELSTDESVREWLTISEQSDKDSYTLGVRVGLESAFMKRVVRLDDQGQLEPVIRIAAGMALAEHLSRIGGAKQAGHVRRNLNRLLSDALSHTNS